MSFIVVPLALLQGIGKIADIYNTYKDVRCLYNRDILA
jgi:hypothetical protein